MMTITAGANVFKGILKNYDFIGEDELLIRFELSGGACVECTFPKISPSIKQTIKNLKVTGLANSTVDFNKGTVTLNNIVENDGKPQAKSTVDKNKIGSSFLG